MSDDVERQQWLGIEGLVRYAQGGNKKSFSRLMLAAEIYTYLSGIWTDGLDLDQVNREGLRESVNNARHEVFLKGVGDSEINKALHLLDRAGLIDLSSRNGCLAVDLPFLQTWS